MENIKYLIWLTMVFGSTSETIWKIIKSYKSSHDAYCELMSGSCVVSPNDRQLQKVNETSLEQAEKVISYCLENGIGITGYYSSDYPAQFRNIRRPPAVLYYMGNISCLSQGKNITCVGTRCPSEYTVSTISKICTELVINGFTIVSGFAVGADIESHLTAVRLNRPTVCVLGCGIAIDYPVQNHGYREEIIKNGGVLISEFLPETKAFRGSFQKRNILLASLSKATIVFEASEKSGSLSTADEAYKQNKKLLCIPPSDISDKRYAGNIKILRTTATPLYSVEDVFSIYGIENAVRSNSASDCKDVMAEKTEKIAKSKPKDIKTEKSVTETPDKQTTEYSLTPVQIKILDLIGNCTLHIDVIIQKMDMDISDLITELMELQIMGIIEETAGSRFRKR